MSSYAMPSAAGSITHYRDVIRLWTNMHSVFLSRAPAAQQTAKAVVVVPVQPGQWPIWAKAMALMKKEEDKGVGDTVYRVIGPPASEAFQKWYARIFGKSCGCSRRHLRWNEQYRY
jgi:hypothetical protein